MRASNTNVADLSYLIVVLVFSFYSCRSDSDKNAPVLSEQTESNTVNPVDTIPVFRQNPNKEPVVSYSLKTDNPLNDWYFKVLIFETPKTFHFLMRMQYEEIRGLDTLKLPNFGQMPKIEIKKGPERFSCIIGFLDKNNQFKEYKKVYVKNNVLKVTTLNHYVVQKYRKLVEQ